MPSSKLTGVWFLSRSRCTCARRRAEAARGRRGAAGSEAAGRGRGRRRRRAAGAPARARGRARERAGAGGRGRARAHRARVASQVELRADEDHRHVGAVMLELGVPLLLHVLEGRARDEGEGDEDDVGLRVRERTQPGGILLPRGIPKAEVDRLAVDHHVRRVVVEHGRDVVLGEGVGGVCAAAVRGESGVMERRGDGAAGGSAQEMSKQVLPTAPSPTITHFTLRGEERRGVSARATRVQGATLRALLGVGEKVAARTSASWTWLRRVLRWQGHPLRLRARGTGVRWRSDGGRAQRRRISSPSRKGSNRGDARLAAAAAHQLAPAYFTRDEPRDSALF